MTYLNEELISLMMDSLIRNM